MKVLKGLLIGISMYSRLPAPQIEWSRENMRYAMCALPLIGLVIGLILWGWVALADALEIDGFLFGAVYALVPIAVTGGIHMDGLMDTADALGSRADRARTATDRADRTTSPVRAKDAATRAKTLPNRSCAPK